MNKPGAQLLSGLILFGSLYGAESGANGVPRSPNDNQIYVPVAQCRLVDTRQSLGGNLVAGVPQDFYAYGDGSQIGSQGGNAAGCADPKAPNGPQPAAVMINLTVVGTDASKDGNVLARAAGTATTNALVNFRQGTNISNAAIIPICRGVSCPNGRQLSAQVSRGSVPAVIDVIGYFYPKDTNVVKVAKDGGDFTGPVEAMAYLKALFDGSDPGAPSATNPWVIEIDPGLYELGNTPLNLSVPGVTVSGAGQEATILNGDGNGTGLGGTVILSANATRLENLTVTTTTAPAGDTLRYAVYVNGAPAPSTTEPSPAIARVKAVGSGAPVGNVGMVINDATADVAQSELRGTGGAGAFGFSTFAGGSAKIADSKIIGEGGSPTYSRGAVIINGFVLEVSNTQFIADGNAGQVNALYVNTAPSTVRADGCTFVSSGVGGSHVAVVEVEDPTVTIQRSTIQGATTAGTGSGGTIAIGASRLDGATPVQIGLTCAASYNGSFVALNSACQ